MGKIFLDQNEFQLELIKSKEQGKLTNRAVEIILLLVKKWNYKYTRYDFLEDIEQRCIEYVLTVWMKYDPNRSASCMGWFSTVIQNGLMIGYKETANWFKNPDIKISHLGEYEDFDDEE